MTASNARIRMVISDLDGTLVTPRKTLTPRTVEAVRALRRAGIEFAVTSGRPPRGMRHVLKPLGLSTPIAAFNGGMIVGPQGEVLERLVLDPEAARATIAFLESQGLDSWVYRGDVWLLRNPAAPHVRKEAETVGFEPVVVARFDEHKEGVVKIVGVSDDYDLVARCEAELGRRLDGRASAARSQPYYLDVTHPMANKGHVVDRLAETYKIPHSQIATLGDMPNDVLMFEKSGISIAMGNASDEVKKRATYVTASNAEDGFAIAIETFILRISRAA